MVAPPPQTPRRPPTYPPASPYDEPPRRRRRWVPWLLVALLIAAAALAGWWAYNQIQDQLQESAPVGVPLVEGLEEELAVQQIEDAGLEAEVVEEPSPEEQLGIVIEQSPREGTQVSKGSTVTITVGTGPRQVEVPAPGRAHLRGGGGRAQRGRPEGEAGERLLAACPKARSPARSRSAGEQVDEGIEVEVRVSKGPEEVEVPDVLNQSESSAIAELEDAGFEVPTTEAPSDTTAAGLVSAQNPAPGELAAQGSTVAITISTGPELGTVPNVVGETSGDARAMIQDAGFRPRTVFEDVTDPLEDGMVLDQDPGGETAGAARVDRDDLRRPPRLRRGAQRSPGCA